MLVTVVRPIERNMLSQQTVHKWRVDAECRDTDTNLFFPSGYLRAEEKYKIEQIAIRICKSCSVRAECLEYAISNPSLVTDGVWGGYSDKDIQKKQRLRMRQRRARKGKR